MSRVMRAIIFAKSISSLILIDSFVACASASSPGPNPTAVIPFWMSCFVTVAPDIPFGCGLVPNIDNVCFEINSTNGLLIGTAVGGWLEIIFKSNRAGEYCVSASLMIFFYIVDDIVA